MSGAFQPRNEAELSNTLKGCAAEHRTVRLSGGGLVAKNASEASLGVWMFGITGIVEIRENDLVATARAGTSLFEIDQELRERGRRFPLRPHDAGDRATVGGVFACAADGLTGRLGFGARDILLGARAVLADGTRVFVGAKVVKSVSGIDVCKALVGSRGCLAALTEMTFRIEAVPEKSLTLAAVFQGRPKTYAAVAAADALPLAPAGLVISTREEGFQVDVLLEGPGAAVDAAAKRLADTGLRESADDWARLNALATLDPKTKHSRVTGRTTRAAPLDGLPRDAATFVVDVLRGRFYAHCVRPRDAKPEPDPLLEGVRLAFDPTTNFEAGRGMGAT